MSDKPTEEKFAVEPYENWPDLASTEAIARQCERHGRHAAAKRLRALASENERLRLTIDYLIEELGPAAEDVIKQAEQDAEQAKGDE
jgi:hypothetical protein